MENFKPKSLSEMNAEFAQMLAQQIEEKQKNEEAQKLSTPQTEEPIKETIEDAFQIEDDDSMLFEGFDFSVLDEDSDVDEEITEQEAKPQDLEPQVPVQQDFIEQGAASQDSEPGEKINLFEDVKLPIIERSTEEKTEFEFPKEEEFTEPDPTGFFGPPIEKTYKKDNEQKARIEPKFDFEKTDDYSGTQLKKSFRPKKGKSKVIRRLLNAAIIVVAVISLIVGLAAFATAEPGRFLFGKGLLICQNTVENTNLAEGTLLFVQAAASASDDEIVAVYKDSMQDYKLISARDVSFQDMVFAVAKREIPKVGTFLSFVTEKWILFAGIAVALLAVLIILRTVVFKNDTYMIIGENPRGRGKKQILDF